VTEDPLARRSAAVGWSGSLALHALVVIAGTTLLVPPDTGFEFQTPTEIELGLVEATEIEPAPPAASPAEPEPTPASATPTVEGEGEARRDAGLSRDGGLPIDAARRRRDGGIGDSGVDGGSGFGSGPPVAFLPAGAQIALRIDMDRIRRSPLGDDVRGLLRVVPDWQALLGGSGIDPVRDLSRVLVATPNLQRQSIVVAGRVTDEAGRPRDIAEAIATARGVPIEWRDQRGVPATRWPSPDEIERDIGLIGERHFVIARPDDLPRVLAIAAARRGRRAPVSAAPADALLSMEEGEGLSIEVENVAAFVARSRCATPLRLRIGLIETPEGTAVRGIAHFEREADAESAAQCLGRLVDGVSGNAIVALYGLDGPLERLDLSPEGITLAMETSLTYTELRRILGLLRGLLGGRAGSDPSPPRVPAPTPASPASPGRSPSPSPVTPPPPPSPF
jgi:hypothetical protein